MTRGGASVPAVTASGADLVFAAGPLMQNLVEVLPPDRRGGYAATAAELETMTDWDAGGLIPPIDVLNGSMPWIRPWGLANSASGAQQLVSRRRR